MKKMLQTIALMVGLISVNVALAEGEGEELGGRAGLACAAILCLSTGSPPTECSPSLSEYFSIDFDDFSDTLQGRIDFLNLCPVAALTPQMRSLVSAIANGAGRCDAASLNATLISYSGGMGIGQGCIKNAKPSYCTVYQGNEYTDIQGAHYVIDPPPSQQPPYWPFGDSSGSTGIGAIFGNNSNQQTEQCGHWVD